MSYCQVNLSIVIYGPQSNHPSRLSASLAKLADAIRGGTIPSEVVNEYPDGVVTAHVFAVGSEAVLEHPDA